MRNDEGGGRKFRPRPESQAVRSNRPACPPDSQPSVVTTNSISMTASERRTATMRRFPVSSSGSSSCGSRLDRVSSPADLSRFMDASFQPALVANPWRKESIRGNDERFIGHIQPPATSGGELHQQSEKNYANRAGCHAVAEESPQSASQ